MTIDQRTRRVQLNGLLGQLDTFFGKLNALDNDAYEDGEIPKVYKELSGLSLSIAVRCDECVNYHIDASRTAGASPRQLLEAIKLGVAGGGSITLPNARNAIEYLRSLEGDGVRALVALEKA